MPIYPNIYQTLLPGPIVELRGYLAACGLRGRLYAYLNYNGPTGTARDELAEGMLALALERGALTPGQTIVEAVSGPFATALTLAGLTAGHPVTLVMPEDAPAMRQESLLRLGAQIIHTPAQAGLCRRTGAGKSHRRRKGLVLYGLAQQRRQPHLSPPGDGACTGALHRAGGFQHRGQHRHRRGQRRHHHRRGRNGQGVDE